MDTNLVEINRLLHSKDEQIEDLKKQVIKLKIENEELKKPQPTFIPIGRAHEQPKKEEKVQQGGAEEHLSVLRQILHTLAIMNGQLSLFNTKMDEMPQLIQRAADEAQEAKLKQFEENERVIPRFYRKN